MIKEIKNYFKNVVLESTNIPEDYIYYTLAEVNQYNAPYTCKIITEKSTVKEIFNQEKRNYENNKIKLWTRKYSVITPFLIGFYGEEEETVDNWIQNFLKKIKRYITIDNQAIYINPVAIEYSDAISVMNVYVGVIEIECSYGVYEESLFDKITEININKL